ncbi:HAD-like domain-containing protein [Xylariomycetidae sp. FL0641]|nr:HAD-like domain-containing protein [Xylariomycetidae sp. FL0641]
MAAPTSVNVLLLDIEGTVCPISFVKDILFPYALKVLPKTLENQWDDPAFAKYREAFPSEHAHSKEALLAHVSDLMEKDLKIPYLKSLQGYLWAEGYASGDLKAPLFPDVSEKLSAWHQRGLSVMIYSSGSVPAQKLLFKHTNAEPSDLSPLISDWFDTVNAGLKTDTSSYETIAACHPEIPIKEWLFLSDNVKEVEAAVGAGMQSMIVQRPGNPDIPSDVVGRFPVIETFEALNDDFSVKKQPTGQKRERSAEPDTAADEAATAPETKKARQTEDTAEDNITERKPGSGERDASDPKIRNAEPGPETPEAVASEASATGPKAT